MVVSSPALRKMVDNAFSWAEKHRLTRTNVMHGEEEARLVLDDGFSTCEVEGETNQQGTTVETEESWH